MQLPSPALQTNLISRLQQLVTAFNPDVTLFVDVEDALKRGLSIVLTKFLVGF